MVVDKEEVTALSVFSAAVSLYQEMSAISDSIRVVKHEEASEKSKCTHTGNSALIRMSKADFVGDIETTTLKCLSPLELNHFNEHYRSKKVEVKTEAEVEVITAEDWEDVTPVEYIAEFWDPTKPRVETKHHYYSQSRTQGNLVKLSAPTVEALNNLIEPYNLASDVVVSKTLRFARTTAGAETKRQEPYAENMPTTVYNPQGRCVREFAPKVVVDADSEPTGDLDLSMRTKLGNRLISVGLYPSSEYFKPVDLRAKKPRKQKWSHLYGN